MPLMNSTGAFKQQHFFSTTGVSPTNYIDTLTAYGAVEPTACVYTSNGGSMVIGFIGAGSSATGFVFSTTNNGTFANQTFISTTSVAYKLMALGQIVLDASDNGYIAGTAYEDTVGENAVLFKINSSLSIQWQKKLTSVNADRFFCIALAGSNLYVGGQTYNGTTYIPILASYNTSGTLQFQKTFSNCTSITSVATDSSNNYYATAQEAYTGSIDGVQLTKWDSSNTFQWGKRIYGASDTSFGTVVKTDSSGNVYVLTIVNSYPYLLKFNSSGTIQWQKRIDIAIDSVNGMTLDDTGNIYISLVATSVLYQSPLIKISPSGTIVWNNRMEVSPNYWNPGSRFGLSWKFNHLIMTLWKAGSGNPGFTFSLPDDGSKLGTYPPYLTYAAGSATVSSSALNIATQLNTSSSLTLTDSVSAFPSSTGNITQSVVQI